MIGDRGDVLDELKIWHEAECSHLLIESLSEHGLLLVGPEGEKSFNQIVHSFIEVRLHHVFMVKRRFALFSVCPRLNRIPTILDMVLLFIPLRQHVGIHELLRVLEILSLLFFLLFKFSAIALVTQVFQRLLLSHG